MLQPRALLCAGVLCSLAALARGQCELAFPGNSTYAGVEAVAIEQPSAVGEIYAATWWDSGGTGPGNRLLVFGGRFGIAGDRAVGNIASYDPVTDAWGSLGDGHALWVRKLWVSGTGAR